MKMEEAVFVFFLLIVCRKRKLFDKWGNHQRAREVRWWGVSGRRSPMRLADGGCELRSVCGAACRRSMGAISMHKAVRL